MSAVRIDNAQANNVSEMPRNEVHAISWSDGNQSFLVMEFVRLRRKLGATNSNDDSLAESLSQLGHALHPPSAIDQLSILFELSTFERQLLLLAAGIEMDSTLANLCAEALGRELRGAISFSFALATLDDQHWSALAPSGPLRRFQLIQLDASNGLTTAALRIDERILHYLAGVNHIDPRLEPLLHTRTLNHSVAPEHTSIADEALLACAGGNTVVQLCGDDPSGQEDIAALLASQLGRELYVLPLAALPSACTETSSDLSAASFVSLWIREEKLLPALLLIQCGTSTLSPAAQQIIGRLPAPLVVASREPSRMERHATRHSVNKPSPESQKQLWEIALKNLAGETETCGLIDNLAEQFHLSAETIATVTAATEASSTEGYAQRLWKACRSISQPRLEDLAQRIIPVCSWDDLILPDLQKRTLHQIAAQARLRMTVYESWQFAGRGRRGLGITALFAGASGTGKTLSAEVLAAELSLDLYRIDLSAVVSKYIGESEKNLKQVFDAAEAGGVLLLFDEADALFGKRAEVKDSHDRYANIEVSYLLQRMESFQGIAILTSNLKSSLDKAFQRRLGFIVDYPFPGPNEREAIWRRVFPAAAPTRDLNFKRLAQLNMTGGNIRNIALNAAFLAADAGSPIEMSHLLHATRQEALKTERSLSENEIWGWV